MIIAPETLGLRRMNPADARMFSEWEKLERPYPWTEGQFAETLRSATQQTLVWEQDNVIWGFAVLQIIEGEAYLLNIMIHPDFRRRGKGTAFLDKLVEWSRSGGAEHFFLDVDPNNLPAFRLYRKFGFEITGRRPHGYPRGEESLLMKKYL